MFIIVGFYVKKKIVPKFAVFCCNEAPNQVLRHELKPSAKQPLADTL